MKKLNSQQKFTIAVIEFFKKQNISISEKEHTLVHFHKNNLLQKYVPIYSGKNVPYSKHEFCQIHYHFEYVFWPYPGIVECLLI